MSKDDFWLNSPGESPSKSWGNPFSIDSFNDDVDFSFSFAPDFIERSPLQVSEENPSPLPLFSNSPVIEENSTKLQISHRKTPSSPTKIPFGFDFTAFATNPNFQNAMKFGRIPQPPPKHVRQKSSPSDSNPLPTDDHFATLCSDAAVKFNPHKIGFIPTSFWPDRDFTFGELVSDFFQRKNNANSRFSHKLFNALCISNHDPFYAEFLGVEWITPKILRVDKRVFARLLGIKTIDGSLFHQQGNFPSHGFIELDPIEAANHLSSQELQGVDFEGVRLLTHQPGIFVKGCTESVLEGCKWISTRKR